MKVYARPLWVAGVAKLAHFVPFYGIEGQGAEFVHSLFAPIHRLGRRLRPHVWEPLDPRTAETHSMDVR